MIDKHSKTNSTQMMMCGGYCKTFILTVSEKEPLTLDDVQSRGTSLCCRDQYVQKD